MPDFDTLRIAEHIKTIEKNLRELEALRGRAFEEFEQDVKSLAATKYWLQTAVQAMIDISSHICARLRIVTQPDSGGCIRALEKQGLIPKDRATMYVKMIRFRNVLVHLYGEVDNHRVHEILENERNYSGVIARRRYLPTKQSPNNLVSRRRWGLLRKKRCSETSPCHCEKPMPLGACGAAET